VDERDRRGRYGAVLAIPAFRSLWLAQMLANLGEALSSVALPLLAYAITGSAQLASQVFVARLLPLILLAPLSGAVVDRLDRRAVMLVADIVRAGLVVLIPFCREAWQLAVLAALVAVNDALARPAGLAAVPTVVPAAQLVSALSAAQVGGSAIRVAGPAAGAAIIGIAGPGIAFGLQAVCFVLSAVALLPLRLPRPPRAATMPSLRSEMWEGLATVRDNPVVRGTAAVEALWQTMTAMLAVTLVVYVEQTLRFGPAGGSVYALLMACFSLGTAIGAIVAGRVEARIGRPRLMAIGYLAPLLAIPAVVVPPLPVLFTCWFALGFTDAWAVIAMQAYLAEAAPDRLRGRIYAGWTAAVTAGAAVAFLVIGQLTTAWGPAATIGAAGLLVGAGGPLLLWTTGALAAMRRHVPAPAESAKLLP
jgi:MFS family permease